MMKIWFFLRRKIRVVLIALALGAVAAWGAYERIRHLDDPTPEATMQLQAKKDAAARPTTNMTKEELAKYQSKDVVRMPINLRNLDGVRVKRSPLKKQMPATTKSNVKEN